MRKPARTVWPTSSEGLEAKAVPKKGVGPLHLQVSDSLALWLLEHFLLALTFLMLYIRIRTPWPRSFRMVSFSASLCSYREVSDMMATEGEEHQDTDAWCPQTLPACRGR